MRRNTDYDKKAGTCIKQVRRIFFFTFIFMIISMAVMYGTTEEFAVQTSIAFITIRNISLFNITRTNLSKLSKSLTYQSVNKLKYLEETKTTIPTVSTPDSWKFNDERDKTTTAVNAPDSLKPGDERNTPKAAVNAPGSLKLDNGQNSTIPGATRSTTALEFPGMPDPCSKPRRFTGVEDLLCMKRPNYLPEYKNPCWRVDGKLKCIGYFQLFGVCKSGTSDFFKRLLLHPGIVPNRGIFGKEIWYWSWKRLRPTNRGGLVKQGMTFEEYTRQFQSNLIEQTITANGDHPLITGSGDPMDFWDEFGWKLIPQNDPKASEPKWTTPYFVYHMNPKVKLILMLRDPVERLFSHYLHSGAGATAQQFHEHIKYSLPIWNNCVSKNTIRHCIYDSGLKAQLKAPIYGSFYNIHLKEWLKVFPRQQMFIFRNEDYTTYIRETLESLFTFLEIDIPPKSTFQDMFNLPHFYETKQKLTAGPLKPETKKLLVDFYRPHMEELASILNDERFLWKDGSFS